MWVFVYMSFRDKNHIAIWKSSSNPMSRTSTLYTVSADACLKDFPSSNIASVKTYLKWTLWVFHIRFQHLPFAWIKVCHLLFRLLFKYNLLLCLHSMYKAVLRTHRSVMARKISVVIRVAFGAFNYRRLTWAASSGSALTTRLGSIPLFALQCYRVLHRP